MQATTCSLCGHEGGPCRLVADHEVHPAMVLDGPGRRAAHHVERELAVTCMGPGLVPLVPFGHSRRRDDDIRSTAFQACVRALPALAGRPISSVVANKHSTDHEQQQTPCTHCGPACCAGTHRRVGSRRHAVAGRNGHGPDFGSRRRRRRAAHDGAHQPGISGIAPRLGRAARRSSDKIVKS
jgi:hypothetical protein